MAIKELKKYSDGWFADLYLRYGSVEEVFRTYPDYLPISVASFHRKVAKRGLVRSPGRQVNFFELLHFFREKALAPGAPLENLYRKMPPSFQTSLVTLHRIYHAIVDNTVRREVVALVISEVGSRENVLVGNETRGNLRYGKRIGDVSIPVGYAKKRESDFESVLRLLQNEFSTKLAISGDLALGGKLAKEFIPEDITPFMYLDILDVRVRVYALTCPKRLVDLKACSSYNLEGHRFINIYDLSKLTNLRLGMLEVIEGYRDFLMGESAYEPQVVTSNLNRELALATF